MSISEFVISHEVAIRLGSFLGILGAMSLWKLAAPRRVLTVPKLLRWINNIGIVVINSFLLRIVFPSAAVGVSVFAQKHGWGLFNYIQVSYTIVVIISVVALDFTIYLQHVMFHAVP